MRLVASVAFLGLAACGSRACPESEAGTIVMGDANADGVVDLSDGIYLQRWVFRGGTAPACDGAVDLLPDGSVDAADAMVMWEHAFGPNGAFPEMTSGACDSPKELEAPDCGRMELGIDAPKTASGTFDAAVTLTTRDLDVEGWQLSVQATGCSIASATLDGTVGADKMDGGKRATGYARADLASQGVVSAVALSWLEEMTLPASDEPYTVLSLHVEPGSDCTCELSFTDGLVGAGEPVRNAVTHEGRAYLPKGKTVKIKTC